MIMRRDDSEQNASDVTHWLIQSWNALPVDEGVQAPLLEGVLRPRQGVQEG